MENTYNKTSLIKLAKDKIKSLKKLLKETEADKKKQIKEAEVKREAFIKEARKYLPEINGIMMNTQIDYLMKRISEGRGKYEKRRVYKDRIKGYYDHIRSLKAAIDRGVADSYAQRHMPTAQTIRTELYGDTATGLVKDFLKSKGVEVVNVNTYITVGDSYLIEGLIRDIELLLKKLDVIAEDVVSCTFIGVEAIFNNNPSKKRMCNYDIETKAMRNTDLWV